MQKISVRHVKFTPEEMAYDPSPEETANWMPVYVKGWPAFRRFLKWKRQLAKLEPEVRKAFPDDKSVNAALRNVMEAWAIKPAGKRRKTA